MLTPFWQIDAFIIETIILMPFYILMLIDIIISRKSSTTFRTPYYTLIISQGIADVYIISLTLIIVLARYFSFGNELIYSLQPYGIGVFYANCGPFMFVTRIFGVFLITFQRFISVCKPLGRVNLFLNNSPPLYLYLIHWLGSLLIHMPSLINSDGYFEDEETLYSVTSEKYARIYSITAATSFLIIGTLICMMYVRIVLMLLKTRKITTIGKAVRNKSHRSRDIRIFFHLTVLIVFALIGFLYNIGEFVYSSDLSRTEQRAYRRLNPLLSGNLSFVNPVVLILLNTDIQTSMFGKFSCIKKSGNSTAALSSSRH